MRGPQGPGWCLKTFWVGVLPDWYCFVVYQFTGHCPDSYGIHKKYNKYKLKFKSKPWIPLDLQKSVSVKNKLLTNFINKKEPILKKEFHTKYEKYRNLLSTLTKKSKQACYDEYFERN